MISTGSYKNCNSKRFRYYSISSDNGIKADYQGQCYSKLMANKELLEKLNGEMADLPEQEKLKWYVTQYYKNVLSNLDPLEVHRELEWHTLVDYEDSYDRHIVAAWLNLLIEVDVPEIVTHEFSSDVIDRAIDVRDLLEEAIIDTENMRGFKSVRARYLFMSGEKLECKANDIEETNCDYAGRLRQEACYLRCDADRAEDEYRERQSKKVYNK